MRNGFVKINGENVELYNFDYQKSELFPHIRNVHALTSFEGNISGARKQMYKSHSSQRLIIKGATRRRIFTGSAFEYAKTVFKTSFDYDSEVIEVIPYYRPTFGSESLGANPESLIIFEYSDPEDNRLVVDCMTISEYTSHHSYFGYKNKRTPLYNKLHTHASFSAGDVLMTSPAVHEDGSHMSGREVELALMTSPLGSEDGVGMSHSLAEELGIITLEKRVVEWGSTQYPINLYGTQDRVQVHPRIGEKIHKSGKLMALRKYDQDYSVVNMSRRKVMEPDEIFDNAVYVDGRDGVVVDIRVLHDPNQVMSTPDKMCELTLQYDNARREYYARIVQLYNNLCGKRGNSLVMSPRFINTVQYAISVVLETNQNKKVAQKVVHPQKIYRGSPIDDFRVEFTILYNIKPTVGFKVTGTQGDKGVVVRIIPDSHMPVDANGNRADIIMDPNATVARMLPARLYEQAFNAASRDLIIEFRRKLGFQPRGDLTLQNKLDLEQRWKSGDPVVREIWARLMDYYSIFSKEVMYDLYSTLESAKQCSHLVRVLIEGIYLYIPGTQEAESVDMLRQVKERFMPTRGPVTYVDCVGKTRVTKNNVLIGSVYMMLLEKTGDDWTAVSSGKYQIFGVLAKLTNKDKYSQPTRNQTIRAGGEAEIRIITAYTGEFFAAEFLDRNSNMLTHRDACDKILSSITPTNIPNLIDRTKRKLGKARSLQYVKHLAYCNGWGFEYQPYVELDPENPNSPMIDYEGITGFIG